MHVAAKKNAKPSKSRASRSQPKKHKGTIRNKRSAAAKKGWDTRRKLAIDPLAQVKATKTDYDKHVSRGRIKKQRRPIIKRKLRGRFAGENVTVRIGLALQEEEIEEILYLAEQGIYQLSGDDIYATIELYEHGRGKIGSGFGRATGRGENALVQSFIGVQAVPREAMLYQLQRLLEGNMSDARSGVIVHSIRLYRRNDEE
jgi:hypothetical protein